jgi:hypothetical protein
MPIVARSTTSRLNMDNLQKLPSPIFPITTEPNSSCKDSNNVSSTVPIHAQDPNDDVTQEYTNSNDTWSSDEFKAQLVLNVT